jgi:TPR repeat protein
MGRHGCWPTTPTSRSPEASQQIVRAYRAAVKSYIRFWPQRRQLYGNGQGVPQDDVRAYLWFNLSAAQGAKDAVADRDIAAQRMTTEQIAEAQKLAREWTSKHTPR